jgi:hypothetical protein
MDRKLEAALEALTDRVMGWTGVTGTAIGERKGMPCLTVYLSGPCHPYHRSLSQSHLNPSELNVPP